MIERHGIKYGFHMSLGHISKLQHNYYNKIKQEYSDAILEHYLKDIGISVDIYIPSKNQIIEIYGDFWHMNPKLFEDKYQNPVTKMIAKDKWEYDNRRIEALKTAGYKVKIVWENDIK